MKYWEYRSDIHGVEESHMTRLSAAALRLGRLDKAPEQPDESLETTTNMRALNKPLEIFVQEILASSN
jgi:hypothetical protein